MMIALGVLTTLIGIFCTVYGSQLNNDLSAQLSSFFETGKTNPGDIFMGLGIFLLIIGAVCLTCGIIRNFAAEEDDPPHSNKPSVPSPSPVVSTKTFVCPVCGTELADNTKFCMECGASMSKPICTVCGSALERRAKFCTECGTPVAKKSSAPQPSTCAKCGTPLNDDARFCTQCGAVNPHHV